MHTYVDSWTPQQWLKGDIKACFDKISHDWMLENIPTEKDILTKFLKAGYLFNWKLFPTAKGSAQGGIISPTIANKIIKVIEEFLSIRGLTLSPTSMR